ncbi:hypothetical protein A3I55_00075 [Candidatus Woesebacteria bacterium RIFCSPLOWO2_02_FULL_42_10]|nr:MAG: hypothetical protein A3I55_00075 [Candidatus Woesebacteria bacterium RIFCSPLOWO2_02_FULL_42_10]OGM73820.1 MAG: hypothetical protein A3H21_04200 [Candidatus Woesebacteria bacterium RIFCSPLOWO2_12_FULL_42_8]
MKLATYKVFLFTALAWGLVTIFLVPPFEVMDEQRHYVRAGAIAEGQWSCTNSKLQISEKKIDLINYSDIGRIAFNADQKFDFRKVFNYRELTTSEFVEVNSGLCYTFPLAHFVAAIGIKIGDLLNNQLVGFYLGRAVNLLVSVSLVAFSIKITPFAKKTMFFVGMIPTVVFFSSSIGYDSIILSSSLLFIAYSLKLHLQKERLKFRDLMLLGILSLPQVLIKPIYISTVAGVFFLVLSKREAKQRLITLLGCGLVFIVVLVYVAQIFVLSTGLNKIDSGSGKEHFFLETDSSVRQTLGFTYSSKYQAERLFSEPQHFVVSFANSVLVFFFGYIITMLGITGWGGFPLNPTVYPLVIFLAILLVGADFGKTKISKNLSLGLFAGSMLSIVLVFVSMYILDTPKDIKPSLILGVQGRYFLPLLLPLFLALQSLVKRKFFWLYAGRAKWLSAAILLLIILGTIESYIRRYYV